ncbi:hypothetical protein ACLSU7_14995 [Bdellovibrio sp. HCB185ZH]|uniref:hypothetical protein n=1 Tax=Bdellovibrio sp. HCB185ZH TaxID=3394235 RepID=UPI0039A51AC7
MISRILLAIALLAPAMSLAQVTCPLRNGESELTINRVMRNFGKYTVDAETVARKIGDPWDKLTDKDIQVAVENLNIAIACADAVLVNPTEAVLPTKGSLMDEKAKAELKEYYLYFMDDFKTFLIEYRDLLAKTLATPESQRDLAAIVAKNQEMNDKVNHAHKKL